MHFESHQQRAASQPAGPQNKNHLVLVALGVWFAVATVVFVWSGVQNNQFAGQLQQSKNSVRSAVTAAPAKIKVANDSGDAAAVVTELRKLSATVSQSLQNIPNAPSLLGVHIGADAERREREQLTAAAHAYAADLTELADFIIYQSTVAQQLQALSLKDAAGYDQTIALADAWREASQKIKDDPKPSQSADVIATLVQKMIATETAIREMAEFYKKADSNGFKAKQTQLAAIITEFKAIGGQISSIGTQLDAELASSHAKLHQNL